MRTYLGLITAFDYNAKPDRFYFEAEVSWSLPGYLKFCFNTIERLLDHWHLRK